MTPPEPLTPEYLSRLLAPLNARRIWVACSGGIDSMSLLHALASRRDLFPVPVGALHVNHHWHPDSGSMEALVERMALAWGVEFAALSIHSAPVPREGLEAWSRRLRYEALARKVGPGELLLTAHHANDQLETLLLALLRGSGLQGLAGMMDEPQPFGAGWLLRPLLGFPRTEIRRYAETAHVPWHEDPSNQDTAHARNYLRAEVVTRIEARWPEAARSVAVSARLIQESLATLKPSLARVCEAAWDARWDALRVARLRELPDPALRLLLRYWLKALDPGIRLPSRAQVGSLIAAIREEPESGHASFALGSWTLALHDGHLFLVPDLPEVGAEAALPVWYPPAREWRLWPGWGIIRLREGTPECALGLAQGTWQISLRTGGETLFRHPPCGHQLLKEILRAERVPPWLRSRIPLVFAGTELLAAGDWFWHADLAPLAPGAPVSPFAWEPDHPALFGEKRRYERFLEHRNSPGTA